MRMGPLQSVIREKLLPNFVKFGGTVSLEAMSLNAISETLLQLDTRPDRAVPSTAGPEHPPTISVHFFSTSRDTPTQCAGLQAVTVATMRSTVFSEVTSCSLAEACQHFMEN
jgi:hypothetical protein